MDITTPIINILSPSSNTRERMTILQLQSNVKSAIETAFSDYSLPFTIELVEKPKLKQQGESNLLTLHIGTEDNLSERWSLDLYVFKLEDGTSVISLKPTINSRGFEFEFNRGIAQLNNKTLARIAEEIFLAVKAQLLVTSDDHQDSPKLNSWEDSAALLVRSPFSILHRDLLPNSQASADVFRDLDADEKRYSKANDIFVLTQHSQPFAQLMDTGVSFDRTKFQRQMAEILQRNGFRNQFVIKQ